MLKHDDFAYAQGLSVRNILSLISKEYPFSPQVTTWSWGDGDFKDSKKKIEESLDKEMDVDFFL